MRHRGTTIESVLSAGNCRMTKLIAITMGDPRGIGPEICAKLFS